MLDAYTHLDMTSSDPVDDLRQRMASAKVRRALLVETWSRDNLTCLQRLATERSPEFRFARCFRIDEVDQAINFLKSDLIVAIRVRTADLQHLGKIVDLLISSRKWLLPHAESGISALTGSLLPIAAASPGLRIYLPHLGWPTRDKSKDPDWQRSIVALSRIPKLIVGVSAISHFSRQAYPHRDVRHYAEALLDLLGPESLVPGSDYPLFPTTEYSEYLQLASSWIRGEAEPSTSLFEADLFGH
jgi:Amidohydrolase